MIEKNYLELAENIKDEKFLKKIIKEGINNKNFNVKGVAFELIKHIKDKKFIQKILKNYLQNKEITSQKTLYENIQKGRKNFGELLKKDGSITILLDKIPFQGEKEKKDKSSEEENENLQEGKDKKSFKGKIIIRIIDLEPFLAWKKAFEDYEAWKKAGFDYVPVEPILYFSLQNDLKARVYTTVLDNNLENLELAGDKKLKKILKEKLKIIHNHWDNKNICAYFKRDKNGQPILNEFSRQYIIDFDQAQFTEPKQTKNKS